MTTQELGNLIIQIALGIAAAYTVLTMPEGLLRKIRIRFTGRSYADGGLAGGGTHPMSSEALAAAAAAGYGSRIAVRTTADNVAVVCAQDSLPDADGAPQRVCSLTLEQLRALPQGEAVQTLEELLLRADQNAPLLLNVCPDKPDKDYKKLLCMAVLRAAYPYRAFVAAESADPFAVRWFKSHVSNFVRGQILIAPSEAPDGKGSPFAVRHMLGNLLTRPEFYDLTPACRNYAVKFQSFLGAFLILRGVESEQQRITAVAQGAHAVVFTAGEPKPRF